MLQIYALQNMVKSPLEAVTESQKKLAEAAYEFMTEIGYDAEGKSRMLEFNLQRPIEGSTTPLDIKVQAPFIGLVPLPNLFIDDVQVDFQMEMTATETSPELSDIEGKAAGNANFKFGSSGLGVVSVDGKVLSEDENTNSFDRSARFKVNASELDSHQLEGLTKIRRTSDRTL